MHYKALMMDIDGTTVLSEYNAVPSARVIAAVTSAKEKLHVGMATGRTSIESKDIFKMLQLVGPSIVSGGAQVVNAKTHEVFWETRIPTVLVDSITNIFEKENQKAFINDEQTGEQVLIGQSRYKGNPLTIWNPVVEPKVADRLVEALSKIKGIAAHKIHSWEPHKFTVQVTSSIATKQHGIFEVAKLLGIETHEIIGVGDSYNDFPLLMACGLKIAMGNAAPELKAIADFVAPTVDEDGVAVIIEKFILKK